MTTYRQLPAVNRCIRRWRPFRTPTSPHITPNTHLGTLPPRSHPVLAILGISVRICAPGPLYSPLCPSLGPLLSVIATPQIHSVTPLDDDLRFGLGSLSPHLSSCQVHALTLSRMSLLLLAPVASSFPCCNFKTLFLALLFYLLEQY